MIDFASVFILEVRDIDGSVERLLRDFLGTAQAAQLQRLTHGFELTIPIQCAPDIVRLLTRENVAVYQIARYAKVEGSWRWHTTLLIRRHCYAT